MQREATFAKTSPKVFTAHTSPWSSSLEVKAKPPHGSRCCPGVHASLLKFRAVLLRQEGIYLPGVFIQTSPCFALKVWRFRNRAFEFAMNPDQTPIPSSALTDKMSEVLEKGTNIMPSQIVLKNSLQKQILTEISESEILLGGFVHTSPPSLSGGSHG